MITTEGFRDVIEIGREKRYDGWDLKISFPEPLIERALRLEVAERVHADGRILLPLDRNALRDVVAALVREGVESIAVCLLHAYKNSIHEQACGRRSRRLRRKYRYRFLRKSCRRSTNTNVSHNRGNAYTKPTAARYLARLEERMAGLGAGGELLLMQSSGGINSVDTARDFPVRVIESGPAAGALGAAHYARLAGLDHVLSFDMGGTTAKMCLVQEGRVSRTTEFEVAHVHRFKRGSGIPVRVLCLTSWKSAQAAGRSRIYEVGTLQVGPESAGAARSRLTSRWDETECVGCRPRSWLSRPGSLSWWCYVAGHVGGGSGNSLYGRRTLGLDVAEAAFSIHGIVNENMAAAAKVYVTEHGEDPAFYTLVAFGGCGPVHAFDLARSSASSGS